MSNLLRIKTSLIKLFAFLSQVIKKYFISLVNAYQTSIYFAKVINLINRKDFKISQVQIKQD